MSKLALALRRPAARRLLSRACANLVAVVAITTIFALKALFDLTPTAEAAPAHPGYDVGK
ncbi:MAG: hypothetical protein K2Q06_14430 [Parvularculaceae bacterium]|nr:hypothetical protein [Parvularculaceae bacterium]